MDERQRLPEHDPVLVTEEDLEDLASFTGMSRASCLDRLRKYCAQELAEAWRNANPKTPEEILAFYQSTDLYIWALMQWHAGIGRNPYREALTYLVQYFPAAAGWSRVYDFGCGVGTDALYLSSHGYEVTLVDVDCPAFRFARHRFERRRLHARFVESRVPLPEPDSVYDVAVCFDVFEHLPHPLDAAKRLVSALRQRGLFLQQASFMDFGEHPCHLAHGVQGFGGLKWHIHLAGLGLVSLAGMVYRKTSLVQRLIQLGRYGLWRTTGLWLIRVSG
jgi:SAM-dependent methyltransferase